MVLDEIVNNVANNIAQYSIILGFIALIGKAFDHHYQKKIDEVDTDNEDNYKHICTQINDLREDFRREVAEVKKLVYDFLLKSKTNG